MIRDVRIIENGKKELQKKYDITEVKPESVQVPVRESWAEKMRREKYV